MKAEWGQQIRNYVMAPYKMVKDLRTGTETTDVQVRKGWERLGGRGMWHCRRSAPLCAACGCMAALRFAALYISRSASFGALRRLRTTPRLQNRSRTSAAALEKVPLMCNRALHLFRASSPHSESLRTRQQAVVTPNRFVGAHHFPIILHPPHPPYRVYSMAT